MSYLSKASTCVGSFPLQCRTLFQRYLLSSYCVLGTWDTIVNEAKALLLLIFPAVASPGGPMSLQSRVAAVRGGKKRKWSWRKATWERGGLEIWGSLDFIPGMWQFLLFTLHEVNPLQIFCRNAIVPGECKTKADASLIHSHLLLVGRACLSGPCSALTSHKVLPRLPIGTAPHPVGVPLFIVLLVFGLVLNSWSWSLLVQREPWDAGALRWFLLLLLPCPCTCAFYTGDDQ